MSDVVVAQSPISGRGVFAARPFAKGEVILPWDNSQELTRAAFEALPEAERNYIDIQDGKILLVGEPERYVNHSCKPNTLFGRKGDVASCNIEAGEEITTDYANFFVPKGSFRCACGSAKCRGMIVGRMSGVKSVPSARHEGPV